MASQQKVYGKGKGKGALLPPLWESPSGEKEAIDEKTCLHESPSHAEEKITEKLGDLKLTTQADSAFELGTSLCPEKSSNTRREISSSPKRRSTRSSKTKTTTPAIAPIVTVTVPGLNVDALVAESRSGAVKSFSKFADALTQDYDIKKLAEGSFGDVYKLMCRPNSSSSAREKLEKIGGVVLKVIPLTGKTGLGSRKYTKVHDALGEIKILKALDPIPGFTRFRDVHIVQGKYPKAFLEAWHDHKDADGESANQDPDKAFKPDQMFAIFDMDDAGKELGVYDGLSIFQAYDTFWACAIILANGEATVGFETRDMHVSNICLKPLKPGAPEDVSRSTLSNWPANQTEHLGHSNIGVTLIDYTLSRAVLGDSIAHTDLNRNCWLFKGPVFGKENLQARAYRQMNEAAKFASGGRKPDWSNFFPATNLVWLEYLLETLLFTAVFDEVLEGSNSDCILAQQKMRETLKTVLVALKKVSWDPENAMKSAEGLLVAAVEKKWLGKEELALYVQRIQL